DILDFFVRNNVEIGVLTSATIKNIDWKYIFDRVKWCRISCDGFDKETYKKVRGNDKFEIVKNNLIKIVQLLEYSKRCKKTRINYTKILDINDDLTKLKEFAIHYGFEYFITNVHQRKEYDFKKQNLKSMPELCPSVCLHAMVESDGSVYPCCILMNEVGETIDNTYCYGNLNDCDFNFNKLWYSEKAKGIRLKLFCNRIKKCNECADRYLIANKY
ncbi:unnamed protein product, partial [marine sediment metagenome]